MKGYELHKTGSRVNELLERQFVVPTLESKPAEDTLSWEDGEYLVDFRIGELCRVRENEEWVFYRLQDIAEGMAYWSKANASEMPDMSDYYTKEETDKKIEEHTPDLSDYYSKEEVDNKIEEHQPDLSEYYTKEETEQKIEEGVASIVIPEDESIKNVTDDEYNAMFEADTLSDKTMYFVSKDGSPIALYIGKVQIAVREEGSKGFAYNFPIIF
jgi:hypothetical protein